MTHSNMSEATTHPEKHKINHPIRLHYMDNLRALAMFVGVVFHAALAYSPLLHNLWFTTSDQNAKVFDIFSFFTHLFRMPLFFLISGFFAIMLIQKRGLLGFMKNRSLRILLPLIIFLPLLTLFMAFTFEWALANVKNMSPVLSFIKMMASYPDAPPPPLNTMHLWFLYYLFMFVVLTAFLYKLKFFELGIIKTVTEKKWIIGLFPLLLVPVLFFIDAPHPAPEQFLPQFWALGFYGLFFLMGCLIYYKQDVLDQMDKHKHILLIVSLVLYAFFYVSMPETVTPEMAMQMMAGFQPTLSHLPIAIIEAYVSVFMTMYCLLLGKQLLNKKNKILKLISDSSYWIYLIHLPVLFLIQFYLMDVSMNMWLKFITSTLLTFTVGIISYLILVKHTPIGWLLNGRKK